VQDSLSAHIPCNVLIPVSMNGIRVRNIDRPLIGTQADTRRTPQAIRHDPQLPGSGVEAIHMARQLRLLPEVLLKAMAGIREP